VESGYSQSRNPGPSKKLFKSKKNFQIRIEALGRRKTHQGRPKTKRT
jgi:hypothetical protein